VLPCAPPSEARVHEVALIDVSPSISPIPVFGEGGPGSGVWGGEGSALTLPPPLHPEQGTAGWAATPRVWGDGAVSWDVFIPRVGGVMFSLALEGLSGEGSVGC
jgi:hypothetical protein